MKRQRSDSNRIGANVAKSTPSGAPRAASAACSHSLNAELFEEELRLHCRCPRFASAIAAELANLVRQEVCDDSRGRQGPRSRHVLRWLRGQRKANCPITPARVGNDSTSTPGLRTLAMDIFARVIQVSDATCALLKKPRCAVVVDGAVSRITPPMASDEGKICFLVHGVLTPNMCESIIARCNVQGWEPATLEYGGDAAGDSLLDVRLRDSDRCILYGCVDVAASLWEALRPLIPDIAFEPLVPVRVNDCLRCLRYAEGQAGFAKHRDGRCIVSGDISRLTVQVYLNEGFDGGATRLCHADDSEDAEKGFDVIPRLGMVFVFDQSILHKGCPVTRGVKYTTRTEVMYSGRAPQANQ